MALKTASNVPFMRFLLSTLHAARSMQGVQVTCLKCRQERSQWEKRHCVARQTYAFPSITIVTRAVGLAKDPIRVLPLRIGNDARGTFGFQDAPKGVWKVFRVNNSLSLLQTRDCQRICYLRQDYLPDQTVLRLRRLRHWR